MAIHAAHSAPGTALDEGLRRSLELRVLLAEAEGLDSLNGHDEALGALVVETVHEGPDRQELRTTLPADQDRRVPGDRRADTHEHFHEVRAAHGEERHARLAGDG